MEEPEVAYIRALVAHVSQEFAGQRENKENGLRLHLGQLNERLDRLVDAFLEGSLEKERYEERKRRLLLERIETEETLADLKAIPGSGAERIMEFLELSKSALLRHRLGGPEEKRDLVKLLFSNLTVSGKNVSTRLSFPYSEVAKRPKFSRGAPQRIIPRTFRSFLLSLAEGIYGGQNE